MPQHNGAHAGGRGEGGGEGGGGHAESAGGGERDMFAELGFVKEERDLVMKERISLQRSSPAKPGPGKSKLGMHETRNPKLISLNVFID